jgi:hypothetical protein
MLMKWYEYSSLVSENVLVTKTEELSAQSTMIDILMPWSQ